GTEGPPQRLLAVVGVHHGALLALARGGLGVGLPLQFGERLGGRLLLVGQGASERAREGAAGAELAAGVVHRGRRKRIAADPLAFLLPAIDPLLGAALLRIGGRGPQQGAGECGEEQRAEQVLGHGVGDRLRSGGDARGHVIATQATRQPERHPPSELPYRSRYASSAGPHSASVAMPPATASRSCRRATATAGMPRSSASACAAERRPCEGSSGSWRSSAMTTPAPSPPAAVVVSSASRTAVPVVITSSTTSTRRPSSAAPIS